MTRYLFRVRRVPDGLTVAYDGDLEDIFKAIDQACRFLEECEPGGLVRVYRADDNNAIMWLHR